MSKTHKIGNPNQQEKHLLSGQDRLPENDLVYFILDTVNELDISAITAKYEHEERVCPPCPSRMMVALLLYSYCRGVFSSRKIMQACQDRLRFRAIVGDNIPNWRTISDFRKLHIKELEGLFVQVLRLSQTAGLDKLGHIALDSTKGKANANQHKAMSNGRTKEEGQRFQHEIHRLLSEAEAVDQQEDQRYGTDYRGEELREQFGSPKLRLRLGHKWALKAEAKTAGEQGKADSKSDEGSNRGRKRTVVLHIPADGEISLPTWESAARKCLELYREMISQYKNCTRRMMK